MKKLSLPVKIALTALFCLVAAGGVVFWTMRDDMSKLGAIRPVAPEAPANGSSSSKPFIDYDAFEDGGIGIAIQYTGSIRDPKSLKDLRAAVEARGRVGLATLKAEYEKLKL